MMNEENIIERLKEDAIQKLGRTLDSPTDFDYLALQVKNTTGEDISSSTLKRLFRYIPSSSSPRRSSLSILARYVGFTGWSNYVDSNTITSGFISSKVILSENLHEGDIIEVEWDPDRKVTFVALGNNKFAVAKSINSQLAEGATMEIMIFNINQPLQVKNVLYNNESLGHYTAGNNGGLKKIHIIK